MKCPRCDADMSAQKKCSKCGFYDAGNLDELEVEYKDFKTSELLEIRRKKQTTPPAAETKILVEQPGDSAVKRGRTAGSSLEAKKRSLPILAIVVLMLALIFGGLLLVRLLVMQ